ncbi:MAG: YnbE family lipoprotein [Thermodesulfobacteriota bacterium]|nr:YnbE family lipoprotein [Thermodesulfobacteriota bacterium]
MRKKFFICLWAAAFLFTAACTHKVQVEPIHITVDINIKVDKALDDFFSDIDAVEPAGESEKR